jgi:hypothetical protein
MKTITPKQARYIVYLIEYHRSDAVRRIFENQPKNNAKYPDERADYRRTIFAEALEQLNNNEAQFIISQLARVGHTGGPTNKLMRLLFNFGLVPPMPHPETGASYDDDNPCISISL